MNSESRKIRSAAIEKFLDMAQPQDTKAIAPV
jgi:hypothetical protein